MSDEPVVAFDELEGADLHVDRLYDGGRRGRVSDDPLSRLLPVGLQGGFRVKGSVVKGTVVLGALFTTNGEADWPDSLDPHTGVLTYFGDNRRPGHELHDTPRSGNRLLRDLFSWSYDTVERRRVPPLTVFEKAGPGRRIRFRGLAVPGAAGLSPDDELQAVWRTSAGARFQNYRARFTILDVPSVGRRWLEAACQGRALEDEGCPDAWAAWVDGRKYTPLTAPPTTVVRTREQQLPSDRAGQALLDAVRDTFRDREHDFERCAVELWRLIAPATGRCDVTRASRDGGRDAVGEYVVGPGTDAVTIDFALEAKCYSTTHSVGVREVSRLISRIRHRNFGVLVTTSYVDRQAYAEVRDDGHPIVFVSGRDIVDALRSAGHGDIRSLHRWLAQFVVADRS